MLFLVVLTNVLNLQFQWVLSSRCEVTRPHFAASTRMCVCVCVSGQYHQYCSAHDEWLIMKLCMYVRYHTANNVSHFGGDPVTQINLINLIVCVCVCVSGEMSPYCSAHDEWLIMKLCIYVRYHTVNNVSNFGGDPVT